MVPSKQVVFFKKVFISSVPNELNFAVIEFEDIPLASVNNSEVIAMVNKISAET